MARLSAAQHKGKEHVSTILSRLPCYEATSRSYSRVNSATFAIMLQRCHLQHWDVKESKMDDLELVFCCYFVKNRIGVKIRRHTTLIRGRPYYSFKDGSKLALQKRLVVSDSYLWTDGLTGATITIKKKLGRDIWVLSDGAQVKKDFCFGGEPSWTISRRGGAPITVTKRTSGANIGFVSSCNICLTSKSGWRSQYWESMEVKRHAKRYDNRHGTTSPWGLLFVVLVAGYGYYRVKKWWNGNNNRSHR